MSGPYCKTCEHYRPMPFNGGECGDPTKIISVGKGDVVNSPPEVQPDWTCFNHTGLKNTEAEIRQQIYNEVADWLHQKAAFTQDATLSQTADALRQRAGGVG